MWNKGARVWLFFGDRTFTQDFLYQIEFQRYLKDGLLTRLDVAFSRDGANKVYVQDKLKQNAQQVWQCLQDGAYLYICGDADRMAKDVQSTLLEIAQQQGEEVALQSQMLDKVDKKLDRNLEKMTNVNTRMKDTLEEVGRSGDKLMVDIMCIVLAIGFGAQELVRDVISGFFMILENQIRVGDMGACHANQIDMLF